MEALSYLELLKDKIALFEVADDDGDGDDDLAEEIFQSAKKILVTFLPLYLKELLAQIMANPREAFEVTPGCGGSKGMHKRIMDKVNAEANLDQLVGGIADELLDEEVGEKLAKIPGGARTARRLLVHGLNDGIDEFLERVGGEIALRGPSGDTLNKMVEYGVMAKDAVTDIMEHPGVAAAQARALRNAPAIAKLEAKAQATIAKQHLDGSASDSDGDGLMRKFGGKFSSLKGVPSHSGSDASRSGDGDHETLVDEILAGAKTILLQFVPFYMMALLQEMIKNPNEQFQVEPGCSGKAKGIHKRAMDAANKTHNLNQMAGSITSGLLDEEVGETLAKIPGGAMVARKMVISGLEDGVNEFLEHVGEKLVTSGPVPKLLNKLRALGLLTPEQITDLRQHPGNAAISMRAAAGRKAKAVVKQAAQTGGVAVTVAARPVKKSERVWSDTDGDTTGPSSADSFDDFEAIEDIHNTFAYLDVDSDDKAGSSNVVEVAQRMLSEFVPLYIFALLREMALHPKEKFQGSEGCCTCCCGGWCCCAPSGVHHRALYAMDQTRDFDKGRDDIVRVMNQKHVFSDSKVERKFDNKIKGFLRTIGEEIYEDGAHQRMRAHLVRDGFLTLAQAEQVRTQSRGIIGHASGKGGKKSKGKGSKGSKGSKGKGSKGTKKVSASASDAV